MNLLQKSRLLEGIKMEVMNKNSWKNSSNMINLQNFFHISHQKFDVRGNEPMLSPQFETYIGF